MDIQERLRLGREAVEWDNVLPNKEEVVFLYDLIHELQGKIKDSTETLSFYADENNYKVDVINQWEPIRPVLKDNGEKARQILEKPYSKEDYEKAKQQNLDLDNWNDYVTFYKLGEQE